MTQATERKAYVERDLEAGANGLSEADGQKGLKDSAHVVARQPSGVVEETRTIFQGRKLANPGPVGLFGFGMTTLMLSYVLMTWAEEDFVHMVFGYAAFFGGLTQWLAGIFEIIAGNTFGAVAFLGYGAFWFGWWLLQIFTATGDLKGTFPTGEALYYGQWAIFTFLLFIITLRKNWCLRVIFGLLTCAFAVLAGSPWSVGCAKVGGYFAFFCGLSACYAAFAELYYTECKVKLPGL